MIKLNDVLKAVKQKLSPKNEENMVHGTSGGEMPDPDRVIKKPVQ